MSTRVISSILIGVALALATWATIEFARTFESVKADYQAKHYAPMLDLLK